MEAINNSIKLIAKALEYLKNDSSCDQEILQNIIPVMERVIEELTNKI